MNSQIQLGLGECGVVKGIKMMYIQIRTQSLAWETKIRIKLVLFVNEPNPSYFLFILLINVPFISKITTLLHSNISLLPKTESSK